MKEDTPGEKLVRIWIWEYVLKFTSDARLIKELTDSLAFPKDEPRLKQMVLLKELSSQLSKGLDVQKTLEILEAFRNTFGKNPVDDAEKEAEDGETSSAEITRGRRKRLKGTRVETQNVEEELGHKREKPRQKQVESSAEDMRLNGLKQSIEEVREEVQYMLAHRDAQNETARKGQRKEVESKLRSLIGRAWTAFGPVFLEKAEAAVSKSLYKPGGPVCWLSEDASLQNVAEKMTEKEVGQGTSADMETARQALAESCRELRKVVKDPLPALLRKPDAGAQAPVNTLVGEEQIGGVRVKRSLLDPHSSAQAQVWEDDEIAESPPDSSPSASRQVRLPPLTSPIKGSKFLPTEPTTSVTIGFSNRRIRKKWSDLEVETLKREVQKYGKGRWKLILNTNLHILHGRTEVDIKDKWRNLEKYGGAKISDLD